MNTLPLINTYKEYIKESSNSFQKIDIGALIAKNPFVGVISEIKPLISGKMCQWVSLGTMKIYKEIVHDVGVRMNSKNQIDVYFNNKSVNPEFAVDVELINTYDVIGFPSGEILSLSKEKIEILMQKHLVKYLESLRLDNGFYMTKIFFFNDYKYEDIIKTIALFVSGDILVCKGMIGREKITGELATVINHTFSINGPLYYVNFRNPIISNNPNENKYWLSMENIEGKINQNKSSNQLEFDFDDREEHEIDDDYHIKQLYKKDGKNKYE